MAWRICRCTKWCTCGVTQVCPRDVLVLQGLLRIAGASLLWNIIGPSGEGQICKSNHRLHPTDICRFVLLALQQG